MSDSELNKQSSILEAGKTKIQQIWTMQQQIKHQFSKDKVKQKCIFLVGDTNVGKTTLLYYLSGMKLNLIENQVKKTKQIQPQTIYQKAFIRNTLSTTQIPNIFSRHQGSPNVSLIDMPGMNDNRFLSLVSNIFTFDQIFSKIDCIKKIHIVFVISQERFDAQDIKQNLREFIEHFSVGPFQQAKSISLIFSKTESEIESVREVFFESLDQIKEDIEQDEQHIVKFIQILEKLNSTEQFVYSFPKEEPNQQLGQQITEHILSRGHFIDNDKTSILNTHFFQNALLSSKLKLTSFENNFNEILSQLQTTIQMTLSLAIQLNKIMHNKFVDCLFENEEQFQSYIKKLSETYLQVVVSFIGKDKIENCLSVDEVNQSIKVLQQKVSEEKMLYQIDRALKEVFDCVACGQSKIEQQGLNLGFLINFTKVLSEVFQQLQSIFRQSQQISMIIESISNVKQFLLWISGTWFQCLSRIQSQSKISQTLSQMSERLRESNKNKWKQLCATQNYFDIFTQFAQKSSNSLQEGSSQYDQQEQNNIMPGQSNIKQLKLNYISPSYYQQVDSIIKSYQSKQTIAEDQQAQTEMQKDIKSIVASLQQKVIRFNQSIEASGINSQPTSTDDQISLMFFAMKNIRHRIFLESALNNFFPYIKFFIYVQKIEEKTKRDKKKVVQIVHHFIDNMCCILEQYSLFEEQILLYLFVDDIQKALSTINRGFDRLKIGQNFITEQLMVKIMVLDKQSASSSQRKEQLSQLVTRCYNYLIAECSSTRQHTKKYQFQLQTHLSNINTKPQLQQQIHLIPQIKLNSSVLDTKTFSIKTICQKIRTIEQRNSRFNIYTIYKDLFPQKNQQTSNKNLKERQTPEHIPQIQPKETK